MVTDQAAIIQVTVQAAVEATKVAVQAMAEAIDESNTGARKQPKKHRTQAR